MPSDFNFPKLPAGIRIGPFLLGEQISNDGNMSRVYRAYTRDQRPLVVKIARSDDDSFIRFLRMEADILEKLHHPGIVRIYPMRRDRHVINAGRSEDLARYFDGEPPWYYAMELLSGGSLEEHYHAREFRRLPIEWKWELIYQIAVILEYLHNVKVAHRDLKMANVVFRTPPHPQQNPQPVLVDFGIAARDRWEPMERTGTLSHLSPERVQEVMQMRADPRAPAQEVPHLPADIWALGVLAYEILMNQYPFETFRSASELARNILALPVPTMAAVAPPPVERIVFRMLAKAPNERPPIAEVIRMLDTESPFAPPRVVAQF